VTETIVLGGTTVRVLVAEEAVTVLDVTLEKGTGAPPHVHSREDETMVVLEGEVELDEATSRLLTPGDAGRVARGVRHRFANRVDGPARVLFVCTPGGLERFFREAAAATTDAEAAAAAERAGLVFG
jgi:quercetin dioxygenase-like cupin family protein